MLMPTTHSARHQGYLDHYQRTGEARVIGSTREVHGIRKGGGEFPIGISVTQISRNGRPIFIGLVRDITQRKQDEEEIRRLAFYDPLTSLPNRRLLMDRVKQALVTSARTGQHGALMFLDLDHFKQLNDTLGHDVGDLLLQQVAQRMRACVREGDSVARLGGDEFVVLLESLSMQPQEAAAQAEAIAGKVMAALGQPYTLREHTHSSTPSLGIVIFLEDNESIEELLKKADVAMYQAKAAGRNTVRFFDPNMQAAAAARAALERDIRSGLALGEFVLHYQVQVDAHGRTHGAEALVRWNHSVRGLVSPAEFIPVAEETGLILPLGQWVLEEACAQLVKWSRTVPTAHWVVSVNVSAIQFVQDNFVESVALALQKTGARPDHLKLELTESMLVHDVDDIIVKMSAIKAMGVGFSLDDFGTGYSSLSYLKRLPLDQLKIDQSFVRDLEIDSSDAVIARTIIALGHSLGLTVIAEGVETARQRDFLLGFGCDAFQGYFYGRPLPVHALITA
jgi:diguanylate cyclase (GGDEF)-like protein